MEGSSPTNTALEGKQAAVNLGGWPVGLQTCVSKGRSQALGQAAAVSVLSDCAPWALCSRRGQGEQVEEPMCLYPPVLKDKGPLAWASMLSTPIFWPRMPDPFACLPRVPYF